MSRHPRRPRTRGSLPATLTTAWSRLLHRPERPAAHGRPDERGEIPAKVIMIVGFAILAAAVVAAITAFVNSQLGKLPGA